MNFKTIVLIIILIAVIVFFRFFYTLGALKKAEDKYNVEKTGLVSKTEALEKEIAAINENKIKIEKELKLEKEKAAQLEKRLAEAKVSLAGIQGKVKKMVENEVVKSTRDILTRYIRESPGYGKVQLAANDLVQKNDKVIWTFFPMRVNLEILKERDNFKTMIPTLEEKCTSLEKQRDYYTGLYHDEQSISQKRKEQYSNENKLRLASEDLYATCKKQLKTGKMKSLLIGGGIGAGLVLIFALLK